MAYVAHAGIQLANNENPNEEGLWHPIKQENGIEFRWRFRRDYLYERIAGVFDDPNEALKCAKNMYVTLFYELVRLGFQIADAGCNSYGPRILHENEPEIKGYSGNESFLFWTKRYRGGVIGPGVYEVDQSIDEFDEYIFLSGSISALNKSDLIFENVDAYYFSYGYEAREYFSTIMLAEKASTYGMKMTIYCGLLEHLSENQDKEQDVLCVIDDLVAHVDASNISSEKKDGLKNFLNTGRKVSSRQKCFDLCKKYAKSNYGEFSCKEIIREAYNIRSAFSHGENYENRYPVHAAYVKLVVLDVIKNYLREKEMDTQV